MKHKEDIELVQSAQHLHFWGFSEGKAIPLSHIEMFNVSTLSPRIMEVENLPNERKLILERPIFHFHDYGRKGKCA